MENQTLLATLRFHADRVELAADALGRALADACQAIEFILRRAGITELKLTGQVHFMGPEGEIHSRLVAVRPDLRDGLVFVDEAGETVDAQSLESEVLRAALVVIDLEKALAVA